MLNLSYHTTADLPSKERISPTNTGSYVVLSLSHEVVEIMLLDAAVTITAFRVRAAVVTDRVYSFSKRKRRSSVE